MGEDSFVAGAGGGVEDEAKKVAGGVAGTGEQDGEVEGKVGVAEEGVEGCLEEFFDALLVSECEFVGGVSAWLTAYVVKVKGQVEHEPYRAS